MITRDSQALDLIRFASLFVLTMIVIIFHIFNQ